MKRKLVAVKVFYSRHSELLEREINEFIREANLPLWQAKVQLTFDGTGKPAFLVILFIEEEVVGDGQEN